MRRERERSNLYAKHDAVMKMYLGYADRLERRAGNRLISDDSMWSQFFNLYVCVYLIDWVVPDTIEELYDQLEEQGEAEALISRSHGNQALWLSRYIRDRLEKDQNQNAEETERELDVCFAFRDYTLTLKCLVVVPPTERP